MRKGFTFGYKKTFESIPICPGPADYVQTNLSDSLTKRVFSMTNSKTPRFKLEKDLLDKPGPGSYDPHEIASQIVLPIIGRSRRDPRVFLTSKDIPGPGKYTIPSPLGRLKYKTPSNRPLLESIDHFSLDKKVTNTPGPGHYSINESFYRSNHSIKITSKGAGKFRNPSFFTESSTPGPGNYSLKSQRPGPKFTFGLKTESSNKPSISQPGPDAYNVNLLNTSGSGNKFFRNHNFSFPKAPRKAKLEINEQRYFPGPGAYNLSRESPLLKENGVIFNSAIRPLYQIGGSYTPGPGTYMSLPSLVKEKNKGYSLTSNIKEKKWRRLFKKRDSYDSIEEEEKKKAQIKRDEFLNNLKALRSSMHVRSNAGTPKCSHTPKQGLGIESFGKLRRTNSETRLKTDKPSDFQLAKNISFVKFVKPIPNPKNQNPHKAFSIGKSVRKLEYLDPGNVNPNIVRSPGPAGYFVERELDKKAPKIATSKRDDKFLVLNVNPGAGSYNYNNSSFIKRPKKKKKLNPNLINLLKRIEMKVHPEKNPRKIEAQSQQAKNKKRNKNKDYAVVIKK